MSQPQGERVWTSLTLGLCFVCMVLYWFFVSRDRILWSDELFGWMLVTDPSWRHMVHAWNAGADGGGLGFYVLCRVWLFVFGKSDLAFRAFSAAGVYAGFVAAWFSLRRFYRHEVTAVTLFTVWFGARTILWQMVQTRFYGLLLGAVAWCLCCSVRSARESDAGMPNRRSTLLATLAANLLLVSTHPLGVVYSGLLLGGAALDDRLKGRRRWTFYLATILPWTVLIASRQALRASALVAKPWFWTQTPDASDLAGMYMPVSMWFIGYLAIAVILGLAISALWRQRRLAIVAALAGRSTILIPGFLLAIAPMLVWLVSQQGTSYFVDRYLLPFTIGIAVLTAEALTQLFPQPFSLARPVPALLAALVAGFLLLRAGRDSADRYPRDFDVPPRDFTGALAEQLPRGVPIVFSRIDMFDVMLHYRSAPDLPMMYLLDTGVALMPSSPRGLVSGTHEMENWRKVGYFSQQIVPSSEFLATAQRFVVVDDPKIPWMRVRILDQPQWRAEHIGKFCRGVWTENVWLVQRR